MALSKERLGRDFWGVLHAIPEGLHDPPTPEERRAVQEWLTSAALIYPCEPCRPGFGWIVSEHPPDFSSKAALAKSFCEWHNAVSVKLGKPVHECGGPQAVKCPACTRAYMDTVLPDLTGLDGAMVKTPEGQRAVMKLIEYEAKKYGVPVPKVYFQENREHCEGTSCSIMDDRRPAETTKIYLNPEQQNFSLRTPLHEFGHYFFSIVHPGGKGVKRDGAPACPAGFECDGGSEDEADKFAFMEMESLPGSQSIYSDPGGKRGSMQETVLRQEPSNVFSGLDALYRDFAGVAKITPQEANEAYTPEILGTALETGFDIAMAPVGQVIANLLSWGVLVGVGTISGIGARDRTMLNEWAAHHGARLIRLADPAYLTGVVGHAKSMGNAVASGKAADALYAVVKRPEEIQSGFRNSLDAIQRLVAPMARSGEARQQAPATIAEQGGGTRPPVFS
jgi:hypothetical protein